MFKDYDRETFNKRLIIYRSQGIPYTLKATGGSYYVYSDAGNVMTSNNFISQKEVGFIHHVKQYILKNEIHLKVKPIIKEARYNKIQYFRYSKMLSTHTNVYEVDIVKAYWNMALRLGVINQEIYEKGLKVSKEARLAALGSLAKKSYVYKFDGKREIPQPVESSDSTKHLWFNICHELGKVMTEAVKIAGKSFIFYWVDGIYLDSKEVAEQVLQFFKDNDFPSQIRRMSSCSVDRQTKKLMVYKTKRDKYPRPFPLDGN